MGVAEKSEKICAALGEVLKEARIKAGLSFTKVEERSGVTRQMVSFLEQGRNLPTMETFCRIAYSLDQRPSEILQEAERRLEG